MGTESVGAPLTWKHGSLFPQRPSWEQDQTRRQHGCDAERALQLMEALGARRIYNYAMGKEPWLEHLLGLGLGEESPQLKESNKLLQRSMALGFAAAESPFGKQEIILDLEPINSSYYANAVEATLPAQTFSPSADAEDQFAF